MNFEKISQPVTLDEAYNLYQSNPKSVLIGGGVFLRLQKTPCPLGIDLSLLTLDEVQSQEQGWLIGSMTSLRSLETRTDLPKAVTVSLKQIGGVALRNMATLGGSVCGKYPFSDINTALVALGAKLHFYNEPPVRITDYFNQQKSKRNILTGIWIPKNQYSDFRYYKKTYTDFSVINAAIAKKDYWTVAIGARPGRSEMFTFESVDLDVDQAIDALTFKDDIRATGEYRKALAKIFVKEMLEEVAI